VPASEQEVLSAVTNCAATVSRVPEAAIGPKTTLKANLGMTTPDLVRFCDKVTNFMRGHQSGASMAFDIVDARNQTVGGVATEALARIRQ
jgi:hypothetical protein